MASRPPAPPLHLTAPAEGAVRHFVRLAAQALRAPVALLLAGEPGAARPVVSVGAPDAWRAGWEEALAGRLDERLAGAEAVATAQLRAGARFPGVGGCAVVRVAGPGGSPPVALAVLDLRPRAWEEAELELLREIATAAGAALAPGAADPRGAAGLRWRYHWLAGGAGGAVLLPGRPAAGTSAIPPWDGPEWDGRTAGAAGQAAEETEAGLRLRYAAAAAALEGATLEDAFRRALAGVCEHAGCAAARALLWDGEAAPAGSEWWHLAVGPGATGPRPAVDSALVERARRSGEPAWAPDAEAAVPALLWALGARSVLALPVRAGGRVAGVVELFPAEASPPEPWLAAALQDAAGHLGRRVERERLEEELRRDERHSRLLVERVGAIVWEADPETFRFTFVSRGAERLLGYPSERWTEDPGFWMRHLHPEDREWAVGFCQAAVVRGEPHDFEYRMIAADGRTVWVRDIVGPREDGKIVGVMVDITGRRAAALDREQLLLAEQAARTRAERAERRTAVLAYASELLHDAFDHTREDLRGILSGLASLSVPTLADYCRIDEVQPDGSLAPVALVHDRPRAGGDGAPIPADADPATHPAVRVARTGESLFLAEASPADLKGLFAAAERRRLPTRLRALLVVPLSARGRTFGALTLATAGSRRHYERDDLRFAEDLARRIALALDNVRLYREAEAAARLRDDVLAIVSHDLRNPLNVVTFSSDVLLRSWPDDPARGFELRQLQGIAQAAERMRRLILDLLDVARVEAGGLPVDPVPCPAGPLVAHALELDAALGEEKGIEVRSLVCDDAPLVLADRERILQVISNLLGNAVRFTPAGGSVTLRAGWDEREVRFALSDTGPGIPAEHLPHVFDRFWRGQRSTRSGAGLGLTIARGIVEAHGGRIWAESTVGEGSTFVFTLPRADARA